MLGALGGLFIFYLSYDLKNHICTYANSPGLSGSLPDTERISRSPVRVTNSPG